MAREIFNSSACRNKIILSLIIIICQFKIICNENKNYFSWDFTDQNIQDIIYAISVDTGISIVTDDTVSGTGSIRFSGTDFSTAFDSFLNSTRLYVTKTDNLWTVSKFKYIQKDNLYYVDAYDLYPYEIIDKITDNVKWIITYDSLPSNKMSVHFKGVTKDVLMESLCKRFGNYEITESESGYNLKQITEKQDFNFSNDSVHIEKKDDESYEVDIKNSNFFDVLEILFTESEKAGNYKSYSILSNVDTKVERSVFVGSDFDDTLEKLCSQNNYTYVKDDNIYYFLNDKESKDSLINGKKEWRYFSLKYTNTDEVLPLIFKKLGNLETIPLLDDNSFICNCNSNIKAEIEKFIQAVDIKKSVYLVNLKYIKPQELMEYLPPTINKNNLFIADNNSSLYFKGTEEAYKTFIEQIVVIDKPATRLSYDLLILQFDENTQNILSSNFSARRIHSGNKNNLSAVLGSVMGFNLNVLTTFGINFAAELQASIEENKTRVYADTTLHGLSGKKISFQNTNTYRYRDNNVNPETGKAVFSGVTREIVTGIKLDVLGWVSGDGTITSNVTASISRQGIDNSSSTGNPPPTTEKIVTTEVTGKSGEPVILSGLVLNSNSESQKGVPLLSKIPIIGNLFKNKGEIEEKSQMVIYLVPHIENKKIEESSTEYKLGNKSESWLYEKLENLEKLAKLKE